MTQIPANAFELVVQAQLIKLLAMLPDDWPDRLTRLDETLKTKRIRVEVGPVESFDVADRMPGRPTEDSRFGPIHRELLVVVRSEYARTGQRQTGAAVRAAMKAAGHNRGASAINIALADLRCAGLLGNDHDRRGYYPAEAVSADHGRSRIGF